MVTPSRFFARKSILGALALTFLLVFAAGVSAQGGDDPPRPPAARLSGLRHEYQTWCNCGPVNLMMALSYYGWPYDQTVTAAWLKPTTDDKNVSPHEMVAFVEQQTALPNMRALWRYGGDLETLRRLIAAGFPVIVESGFQPEGHEWMGHYITVMAYDDDRRIIWTYDSYTGYGVGYGEETDYDVFDGYWMHFNRTFVVPYPAEREADLIAALGPLADADTASRIALDAARATLMQEPENVWALFNAGTSAAALGYYPEAANYFDVAHRLGWPFRMVWYQFGPYDAYYHAGRYYDVLALAAEVEEITTEIEETDYWVALALAALGDTSGALARLDRGLAWNPNASMIRAARESVAAGTYHAPAPLWVMVPELP